MVGKREKGKIAHHLWPGIAARYGAGESLASIARSFGCTAPAIRYIVKRGARPSPTDELVTSETDDKISVHQGIEAVPLPLTTNRFLIPGKGINQNLRERVNSDIAAFLVAFDMAFENDSPINRDALLQATDRLLRAGARTRLMIEEMEEVAHGRSAEENYSMRAAPQPRR